MRGELTQLIPEASAEPLPLRRFSLRTVLSVSLLLVAAVVAFGTFNLNDVVEGFRSANPVWLAAAFGFGLSTYFGAALGLASFTQEKLGLWRTTKVQIASSIVSLVAPAGVGPAAIDLRYLSKQKVPGPLAVATVSLTMVSRFVVTGILLVVVTVFTGSAGTVTLPSGVIIGTLLVAPWRARSSPSPRIRAWVMKQVRPVVRQGVRASSGCSATPRLLARSCSATPSSRRLHRGLRLTLAAFATPSGRLARDHLLPPTPPARWFPPRR